MQRVYPPIADYAVIGDCRSAGLVSREGSLDWLCLPRFDSAAVFGALVDQRQGGRLRIQPVGAFRAERQYVPSTNVLETTFTQDGGVVRVRDLMAVAADADQRRQLTPEQEVLREVEGVQGEVEIEVLYEPRPGFGAATPTLRDRGAFGTWLDLKGGSLVLASDVPMRVSEAAGVARGYAPVRAGERRYVSLSYASAAPAVVPPLGAFARERVERSIRWWQQWTGRCTYDGPYRDAVVRSVLALKLLAYAPSGAIVAAPTTSLPERIGGDLNWDYRYCWLRDASLTMRALLSLDYEEEAGAFMNWILHATRLTWPRVQVVYDVFGETRLAERDLTHLEGYAGSRPVRIGNGAYDQLQLDVYGDIADAALQCARRGVRFDSDSKRLLHGLGQTVLDCWQEPDDGIWEPRGQRRHYTHSKVLCWVALDRLIALHEEGHLDGSCDDFVKAREEIRTAIEQRGYSTRLPSYTQAFDGDTLDASLLVLPSYGYVAASDPRMHNTYERIRERLGRGALLYRYLPEGSSEPEEGAFGICGFWGVEYLARAGRLAEAHQTFQALQTYANDVGLYGEETDPATGAALGNFPQGFTHIGLINAAVVLAEAEHKVQRFVEPASVPA